MTTTINANTSAGLVYTADTSGIVKLQSNGVTTNALAWVNFNGTGTVAIRSSYNVSSITDNATGDYTVNFTNALSDANYCSQGTAQYGSASNPAIVSIKTATTPTTTAINFIVCNDANTTFDSSIVNILVFGN